MSTKSQSTELAVFLLSSQFTFRPAIQSKTQFVLQWLQFLRLIGAQNTDRLYFATGAPSVK